MYSIKMQLSLSLHPPLNPSIFPPPTPFSSVLFFIPSASTCSSEAYVINLSEGVLFGEGRERDAVLGAAVVESVTESRGMRWWVKVEKRRKERRRRRNTNTMMGAAIQVMEGECEDGGVVETRNSSETSYRCA